MKFPIPKQRLGDAEELVDALVNTFPERAEDIRNMVTKVKRGIVVEISPLTLSQTDPQRGYYHMWKKRFADFCGNTPDEMHEYILREAFGSEWHRTKTGLVQRPLQRSSTADRSEYSELIDTLIRVAANMGFSVPPPEREMMIGD